MIRLAGRRNVGPTCGESGQALLEAIAAAFLMSALFVAVHWLFNFQDMALSAHHASRHLAFLATRTTSERAGPPEIGRSHVEPFFVGPAHQWRDRRGDASVDVARQLHWKVHRVKPLTGMSQPGGAIGDAAVIRREWALDDLGILNATAGLMRSTPRDRELVTGLLQLDSFDTPYDAVSRSIAILDGAGHATSDMATQTRVGESALAWAAAATRSHSAATEVIARAESVDAGWGRPKANLDWLTPWSDRVPEHLIEPYPGN